MSISSADENTALIPREEEADSLSDTSLSQLEVAAIEYLSSGVNSYSRAEDSKPRQQSICNVCTHIVCSPSRS